MPDLPATGTPDAPSAPPPASSQTAPPVVTVRYWAAAKAAAGVAEEQLPARTLAELLDAARARHPEGLPKVLDVCSFVVDGRPAGRRDPASVDLTGVSTVEALPPFAGG